jgi:hypothetical protein
MFQCQLTQYFIHTRFHNYNQGQNDLHSPQKYNTKLNLTTAMLGKMLINLSFPSLLSLKPIAPQACFNFHPRFTKPFEHRKPCSSGIGKPAVYW